MTDKWTSRVWAAILKGNLEDTPAFMVGAGLLGHVVLTILLIIIYLQGFSFALALLAVEAIAFLVVLTALCMLVVVSKFVDDVIDDILDAVGYHEEPMVSASPPLAARSAERNARSANPPE